MGGVHSQHGPPFPSAKHTPGDSEGRRQRTLTAESQQSGFSLQQPQGIVNHSVMDMSSVYTSSPNAVQAFVLPCASHVEPDTKGVRVDHFLTPPAAAAALEYDPSTVGLTPQ